MSNSRLQSLNDIVQDYFEFTARNKALKEISEEENTENSKVTSLKDYSNKVKNLSSQALNENQAPEMSRRFEEQLFEILKVDLHYSEAEAKQLSKDLTVSYLNKALAKSLKKNLDLSQKPLFLETVSLAFHELPQIPSDEKASDIIAAVSRFSRECESYFEFFDKKTNQQAYRTAQTLFLRFAHQNIQEASDWSARLAFEIESKSQLLDKKFSSKESYRLTNELAQMSSLVRRFYNSLSEYFDSKSKPQQVRLAHFLPHAFEALKTPLVYYGLYEVEDYNLAQWKSILIHTLDLMEEESEANLWEPVSLAKKSAPLAIQSFIAERYQRRFEKEGLPQSWSQEISKELVEDHSDFYRLYESLGTEELVLGQPRLYESAFEILFRQPFSKFGISTSNPRHRAYLVAGTATLCRYQHEELSLQKAIQTTVDEVIVEHYQRLFLKSGKDQASSKALAQSLLAQPDLIASFIPYENDPRVEGNVSIYQYALGLLHDEGPRQSVEKTLLNFGLLTEDHQNSSYNQIGQSESELVPQLDPLPQTSHVLESDDSISQESQDFEETENILKSIPDVSLSSSEQEDSQEDSDDQTQVYIRQLEDLDKKSFLNQIKNMSRQASKSFSNALGICLAVKYMEEKREKGKEVKISKAVSYGEKLANRPRRLWNSYFEIIRWGLEERWLDCKESDAINLEKIRPALEKGAMILWDQYLKSEDGLI